MSTFEDTNNKDFEQPINPTSSSSISDSSDDDYQVVELEDHSETTLENNTKKHYLDKEIENVLKSVEEAKSTANSPHIEDSNNALGNQDSESKREQEEKEQHESESLPPPLEEVPEPILEEESKGSEEVAGKMATEENNDQESDKENDHLPPMIFNDV